MTKNTLESFLLWLHDASQLRVVESGLFRLKARKAQHGMSGRLDFSSMLQFKEEILRRLESFSSTKPPTVYPDAILFHMDARVVMEAAMDPHFGRDLFFRNPSEEHRVEMEVYCSPTETPWIMCRRLAWQRFAEHYWTQVEGCSPYFRQREAILPSAAAAAAKTPSSSPSFFQHGKGRRSPTTRFGPISCHVQQDSASVSVSGEVAPDALLSFLQSAVAHSIRSHEGKRRELEYRHQHENEPSIEDISQHVALSMLTHAVLSHPLAQQVQLVVPRTTCVEEWKEEEEEVVQELPAAFTHGAYLQYTHARLAGITRKSGFTPRDPLWTEGNHQATPLDVLVLVESEALHMAALILLFQTEVKRVVRETMEPLHLLSFAVLFCKSISSAMNVLRVKDLPDQTVAYARLQLFQRAQGVLGLLLQSLGLTPIERM